METSLVSVDRYFGLVPQPDPEAHVGLRVDHRELPGSGIRAQGGRRHLRRYHSSPNLPQDKRVGKKI